MRELMRAIAMSAALALLASTAGAQGAKPLKKCAPDAAVCGTVCMDKYEASVWRVPGPTTINKVLVKKIQQGKATVADLAAGGATQLGVASDDYAPCVDSGQNCANDIYAVSLPGVIPSSYLTWFQPQVACENAAKRLPSNAEWQVAAVGTPDPGPDNGTTDCNSATGSVSFTGSRSSCISACGAFDMVGNVYESVADWIPRSAAPCGTWSASVSPTGDDQCLVQAATTGEPGGLIRSSSYANGADGGPLTVYGAFGPSSWFPYVGFRCAR
jgi:Sulfatase-modifying factor enzyme 1